MRTIFSDFLEQLGVPHTRKYSDSRFSDMTFKSLFGFAKLLQAYDIPSDTFEVPDKASAIAVLPTPFIAVVDNSPVIVQEVSESGCTVNDSTGNGIENLGLQDFINRWSGVVLVAYPGSGSAEPQYCHHHLFEIADKSKRWILVAAAAFIFLYLFFANGIYRDLSTVLLTVITAAGLVVTYHLVLKSLNIHSETGDSICAIIDRKGCSTVLATKASSFFGLFGWSEVGLAYFGVTMGCLLVFPQYTGYLALINALCCPFSFWSVWYQKFRAKAWCTLCLITQACLWGSLLCYIGGGWFADAFPIRIEFVVLGATYVAALLAINAIMPVFDRNIKQE